jgi:hypothetical protein
MSGTDSANGGVLNDVANGGENNEVKPLNEVAKLGQSTGGRKRRGNGSRKNSWLAHVKATMKVNRNMSFKQVLKRAKKTYKKSKSQSKSQSSQSGGKKLRVKKGGNAHAQDMFQESQNGGSGMAGKTAFGSTAESL